MFDTKEDRKKMESVVERFDNEMKKVRTGRAHPDMLAGIKVEAYGQFMPLKRGVFYFPAAFSCAIISSQTSSISPTMP